MLIWFVIAIAVVIIAVGGYGGSQHYRRQRDAHATKPNRRSHRGRDARDRRGRGSH